jgi:hypothetical protein
LLTTTLVLLAALPLTAPRFAAWLAARAAGGSSSLGPLDVPGTLSVLRGALVHGVAAMAAASVVIAVACRFPRTASILIVPLAAADLALANAALVVTLPQAVFDQRPALLDVIERAEQAEPAGGPFRVHRMTGLEPVAWYESSAADRSRALVEWRRHTLEPKYGLPYAVEYTLSIGSAELADYREFFRPTVRAMTPDVASTLGAMPGDPMVYYPRRAVDIWNTRYFILPAYPRWSDQRRGIAALLSDVDPIAMGRRPADDWQVLRNRAALPRAWVVHQVRRSPATLREILYPGDAFWAEPGEPVHDPRSTAWVEAADLGPLSTYLAGGRPGVGETVTVSYRGPQRAELAAHLQRPGLVVLSDIFYPGWRLTIDGRPAPILRVNGRMRGAAVQAGLHWLVFSYAPWSFRIGAFVSSLATLAAGLLWLRGSQRDRIGL